MNHNRVKDSGEPVVAGWTVELLYNGVLVKTAVTGPDGGYKFEDLPPGSGYQVRFKNPDSGAVWGSARPNEGGAPFTNGTVDSTTNPTGASLRADRRAAHLDHRGALRRAPRCAFSSRSEGPFRS